MRFSFSQVWIFHQNFQFLIVFPLLVLARPSALLCFRSHNHIAHCLRFFCLSLQCRVWWWRFEVFFSLLSKNKSLKTLSFGALNFKSLHIYRQGKSEIWARLYDSRIWKFFWKFYPGLCFLNLWCLWKLPHIWFYFRWSCSPLDLFLALFTTEKKSSCLTLKL